MTYPLIGNYGRLADDDQSIRPVAARPGRRERDGRRPRRCAPAGRPPARCTPSRRSPAWTRGRSPATCAPTAACAGSSRRRVTVDVEAARAAAPGVSALGGPGLRRRRCRRRPSPSSATPTMVARSSGSSILGSSRTSSRRCAVAAPASGCCPHTRPDPRCSSPDIDGLILSPGPGDPARLERQVALARAIIDDGRPLLGICLGHQIVGRAAGAETPRLRFGHHGANHPVQDLDLGLVQVTAQNHEVQVVGDSLPGRVGLPGQPGQPQRRLGGGAAPREKPIETVQYHPEGAPGPLDALAVFDRFVARRPTQRA